MQFPAIEDTIIAISSGWEARPLGIVRLSGPDCFDLVQSFGATPPPSAQHPYQSQSRLKLESGVELPTSIYWFRRPRSYTGQDLVELHTVGCLPLLRELCTRLIEQGARRALPGEFTARAYLAGKLEAEQVEDVLALISTGSQSAELRTLRARRDSIAALESTLRERILNLLTLIEAGIDFVEEEDIHFISSARVQVALAEMLAMLPDQGQYDRQIFYAAKPHVALAGLPNTGKSTLFNTLLDCERAIVSPVLGTTRDVLSAEIEIGGLSVVLQDCAGLGKTADELELASHLASEHVAAQADLVLWLHPAGTPWDNLEIEVATSLPHERCLLVWSKADLAQAQIPRDPRAVFPTTVTTSAATGKGLNELREVICQRLSAPSAVSINWSGGEHLRSVAAALERARMLVANLPGDLAQPELVALELRSGLDRLSTSGPGWSVEEVLGEVFSRFCVGK